MTTLDDDRLAELVHDAADSVTPPGEGPSRILLAATAPSTDDKGVDGGVRLRESVRRSRSVAVLVAAAVTAIVVAIVLTSLAASGTFGPKGEPVASPPTTVSSGQRTFGQGNVADNNTPLATSMNGTALGAPEFGPASSGASASSQQPSSPSNATGAVPPSTGAVQPKVVAVGTIALSVSANRVQPLLATLTSLVLRQGGYVASSNVTAQSSASAARATIVLRVPEHHFALVVTAVQRDGRVISVVTNSTDVTGQYVNYQDQITAAEASRRQYLAILAKASTIAQILTVQTQINQIQSEIDQLEGARNLLTNEAAYGTLTIQLNHTATHAAPESGLRHAVHNSVAGFVAAVEGLVTGIGPALFALLALGALFLLGRLVWRATRRRML